MNKLIVKIITVINTLIFIPAAICLIAGKFILSVVLVVFKVDVNKIPNFNPKELV